jgi:FtsZ-binding cell division protein ZapB
MGAGTTHRSKTKARGRGLETMMINFSYYELDDLYEIRDALKKAIEDQEAKQRNAAFEQEDMQLEEQLEEWRDTTL